MTRSLQLPSFLPESMRWLLSQGRVQEVVEMLKKIANVNCRYIPDEILQKFAVTMRLFILQPLWHNRNQAFGNFIHAISVYCILHFEEGKAQSKKISKKVPSLMNSLLSYSTSY